MTTNIEIYNKLISIEGRLTSIESLAPTVAALEKIIISGNGEKPMKERMNKVEGYIKSQQDCEGKTDDRKYAFWEKLALGALGAVIVIFLNYAKGWFGL